MEQTFKVAITKKGSQSAWPSIWYSGMESKVFTVIKSIKYEGCFEVVEGTYKMNFIMPEDCEILTGEFEFIDTAKQVTINKI